jgi:hypothetical protein
LATVFVLPAGVSIAGALAASGMIETSDSERLEEVAP